MIKNTAVQITTIISVVVLIIAFSTLYIFNSAVNPGKNSVNVQGLATVKAMPDVISVYFNIETTGNTSEEAKDANSLILDELITELLKQGFERKNIVTENYNIYPNYEWDKDGKQIDKGFKATHSIRVEIDSEDSDKLGSIIDAGANAGAGISYINFELSQKLQNQYKAEAMKLAAEDARIKAEAVAEGFNKEVGDLISTSVNDFGYYPWNVYSTRGMGVAEDYALAKVEATNIQPGEKEVTASVSATFELK
ncbi:MAG: hypothetical protein QT05_C0049G0025 [archaeon GW2011_AR13]|nr:MAG: hypothetical protein QT05_C0049G0025 [archaeon GW2011_AR13]HIG94515.1 SIMPL domain-containing protein [Nanoarchaeota archaeon]HIH63048.1 SIMPL domain-containing protein [Nanoarchaeota archaeon]HIJ09525.1 SIMPL domain-containing protein [Nanoarchaeota archaeon]